MKHVTLSIPITLKELKESILNTFKWWVHHKRRNHNNKVMSELNSNILNELHSGYWDGDISETMRKRLCVGSPNGVIYNMINKAYKKLI